jgi:hypothetical protein
MQLSNLAEKYTGSDLEALQETMIEVLNIDPTRELTEAEIEQIEAHFNGGLALPDAAAAVTDDDVLAIAETSGVDLDVVMQASERLGSLEDLVQWVESYQDLARVHQIKENAKQQFEIDRLEGKEKELADRLAAAVERSSPDFNKIRASLGFKLPKAVERMADEEHEPDFLKSARTALKAQRGMA